MTKHTPGPWTAEAMIHDDGPAYTPVWANTLIAKVYSTAYRDHAQSAANAALIASAPAMLADLRRDLAFAKQVVAYLTVTRDTRDVLFTSAQMAVERLTAAIASAEGQ